MSFIIEYTYGSVNRDYWKLVFLYQFKMEAWLSNNKCDEKLNIVDDENENIRISHKSKGTNILIEIHKSSLNETFNVDIDSNIDDKLMLDDFQTLMNELKTKIIAEHKIRQEELEDEHRELCNIEYVRSYI